MDFKYIITLVVTFILMCIGLMAAGMAFTGLGQEAMPPGHRPFALGAVIIMALTMVSAWLSYLFHAKDRATMLGALALMIFGGILIYDVQILPSLYKETGQGYNQVIRENLTKRARFTTNCMEGYKAILVPDEVAKMDRNDPANAEIHTVGYSLYLLSPNEYTYPDLIAYSQNGNVSFYNEKNLNETVLNSCGAEGGQTYQDFIERMKEKV